MDMRYVELVAPMLVRERLSHASRHHLVAEVSRTREPRKGRRWFRLHLPAMRRTSDIQPLPTAGC